MDIKSNGYIKQFDLCMQDKTWSQEKSVASKMFHNRSINYYTNVVTVNK